ncbi:hypothetical protein DMA11_05945 [Marinilabiliaceae bacterium JC017]|nr:hypothetical protein DMA11_05945 [Marinilabiliaceae bacterium JC017]
MRFAFLVFIALCFFDSPSACYGQSAPKAYASAKLVSKNFGTNLSVEYSRGVIVLTNVRISGSDKAYRFILDSGSDYSLISEHLADAIGFKPSFSEEITDGYEKQKVELGFVDIQLDAICFKEVGVGVIYNAQSEKVCDIDGYIGYNLMKSCIWQLSKDQLVVTDKIKNVKKLEAYSKQKLFNGPVVEAGFVDGFNSTMLFDLGDNGTVEIQESRIDWIRNKQIITGTGRLYTTGLGEGAKKDESIHKLLQVSGFKFGGEVVNDMVVYTDDAPHFPIDVIGAGILKYYNIILDFPGKRLYSQNICNTYINDGYKTCGFKYDIVGNEVVIKFIWNHSAAREAGLKIGQKIESINDTDVHDLRNQEACEAYNRVDALLEQEVVSLKIQGVDDRITLTRSPLFKSKE